jgi:Zn-dependent M16 (insulinase) family peptidase
MTISGTPSSTSHPAFEAVRQQEIASLNIRVEQYEHRKTGAIHYHLAADNTENVFLVALRTVPKDSTGVAHILEHTALCGSERYPVRDPFFMMLRRSLNTFMNAFTSSDWTAYPFASQNQKDFNNLLNVYLDAVFFSRLDPLDFAQEGHRVEFAEPGDANSDLVYKGVVFNEMKGAMSSVTTALWSKLCEHLFPTSTYHYNSGGDPAHIPDLSYDELQSFYKNHYHPSNAIFMTFGDIEASTHQQIFEENALQHFDKLPERIEVHPEQRLSHPKRLVERYALDESEGLANKTHLVMAWMLGESADLGQLLEAQLLSSVLLDNSASPLQQALETTPLGRAPSPMCGLEDSMREMVFCCGIEGSEAEHADALEEMVIDVLESVARDGASQERLEAVLHQLELHQREITGDSYPYGLQLILQALGSATHYSDPIAVLNLDPVIEELRQKIQNPDYIKELAKRLLLENTHRITLVMVPDDTLASEQLATESTRLETLKAGMDEAERAAVIQLATDLEARQEQVDDDSILPRVELTDVPTAIPEPRFTTQTSEAIPFTTYGRGTNGLVYQQCISTLPPLDSDQQHHLPLYSNAITELGLGDETYTDIQERQAATVGGISAFVAMRAGSEDEQTVGAHFSLSSKALLRNHKNQSELMYDTLQKVRFTETGRIRDLVNQQRARRDQSVTGNGHGLAMTAACAGMSPLAKLNHEQSGLAGIRQLRQLDETLSDKDALDKFAAELHGIHEKILSMPRHFLVVAEEEHIDAIVKASASTWAQATPGNGQAMFTMPPVRERRGELWITNTQVNFCARAYPTVTQEHPDAAALVILGGFLRNGFLHKAIREQGGAYGGGATQDSGLAAFRFYSYRDPRLADTLTDFDRAISWMLEARHEAQALNEAILGVIGSMDKPSSPAGEAKQNFYNRLFGRTHAMREEFRQRILAVSIDDLRRVTETYLAPGLESTAVITNSSQLEAAADLPQQMDLIVQEL